MKNNIIFLTVLSIFMLLSCGKETQDTKQGGGISKFKISINPPMKGNSQGPLYSVLIVNGGGLYKQWQSNANATIDFIESPELSVTKDQNVSFQIDLLDYFENICHKVTIEGFINNKSFKSQTIELGTSNCGMSASLNFIIP